MARKIPLERLVLETDSPYFTPKNLHGVLPSASISTTFCHPLQVLGVAVEVAKLRQINLGDVLGQCRANVSKVYGIDVAAKVKIDSFVPTLTESKQLLLGWYLS